MAREAGGSAAQDLGGELDIGLRAGAAMIVDQHRLAVRGRLGYPHVARDHRVEDPGPEMLAHVEGDELAQIVTAVVHGQHHALQFEPRVQSPPDPLDRAHQLAQAFERIEFALHRHQCRVGGDQGVDGQQVQRGRTVDQHFVPIGCAGADRPAQQKLSALMGQQFEFGAAQIFGSRNDREPRDFGWDDRRAELNRRRESARSWSPGARRARCRARCWRCPAGRDR